MTKLQSQSIVKHITFLTFSSHFLLDMLHGGEIGKQKEVKIFMPFQNKKDFSNHCTTKIIHLTLYYENTII